MGETCLSGEAGETDLQHRVLRWSSCRAVTQASTSPVTARSVRRRCGTLLAPSVADDRHPAAGPVAQLTELRISVWLLVSSRQPRTSPVAINAAPGSAPRGVRIDKFVASPTRLSMSSRSRLDERIGEWKVAVQRRFPPVGACDVVEFGIDAFSRRRVATSRIVGGCAGHQARRGDCDGRGRFMRCKNGSLRIRITSMYKERPYRPDPRDKHAAIRQQPPLRTLRDDERRGCSRQHQWRPLNIARAGPPPLHLLYTGTRHRRGAQQQGQTRQSQNAARDSHAALFVQGRRMSSPLPKARSRCRPDGRAR